MGLYRIGNELINKLRRGEYTYMDFYGFENERFNNKIGLFDRAKEFFSNIGVEETINSFFSNGAEKQFNKILKEICDKVNVLPREYCSLPRLQHISMNGYYNFRYPEVSGNDDYTNKLLYYNEQQIIEGALNEARPKLKKLYQKYPQLEEKGKVFEANLWLRLKKYDDARNGRSLDIHSIHDLEKEFGNERALVALASNNGLNAQKNRKIYDILKHAQNTMSATRNPKQMQEVNKIIEELYVVLSNDSSVDLGVSKDTKNQLPFAERFIAFTKEKEEQIKTENAVINSESNNINKNKNISSPSRDRG